jgi:hypothetical protein
VACARNSVPDRRAKLIGMRVLAAEDNVLVSILVENERS